MRPSLCLAAAMAAVACGGCYLVHGDDDDDDTDVQHGDPCEVFEEDADGDGAGSCSDCDDSDPDVYPGGSEGGCCAADGRDNDCDGLVDEEYGQCDHECDEPDDDADDWPRGNDCDDHDPGVNPGVVENVCCRGDGRDNDCDGAVDEQDTDPYCACDVDEDGDGWPAPDDCDDADPAKNPGRNEYCCPCGGGDGEPGGYDPYPDCNGTDDDCDGVADEASENMMAEDEFCCNDG